MFLDATDDDALVARLAQGDRDALRALLVRHSAGLYRLAFRLTGNRDDAEDLVQETFVRVLEGIGRYRPSGRFPAWIRKIAVHLALDRSRRSRRGTVFTEAPAPQPGPEESMLQQEDVRRLRRELMRLPPDYRAVVVLVNGEGLSVREVCDILGLPATVVKNRAYRARNMLRAALSETAGEAGLDGRTQRREIRADTRR